MEHITIYTRRNCTLEVKGKDLDRVRVESMRIGDSQGVVEAGFCDTATSITVRRPTLSLSRDPGQHGGREGVRIRAHGHGETFVGAYPSSLGGRTWVLFVKNKRVEGRVKEETRGHTYLIVSWFEA